MASLRANHSLKPLGIHQAAIKLLSQYDLKPQPASNEEPNLDQFIGALQRKHEGYVQDDYGNWQEVPPEDFLGPISLEALRLINERPTFRLSDALEVYLGGHKKN